MPCKCNIQTQGCNCILQSATCIVAKFIRDEKVDYPIKTLSQLTLILKGFRKECGFTQAAMAEKLGITQQSYAYFEANPATATLDRLFMVLRIMGVEISLSQAIPVTSMGCISSALAKSVPAVKTSKQRIRKTIGAESIKKKKQTTLIKPGRVISSSQKKESW